MLVLVALQALAGVPDTSTRYIPDQSDAQVQTLLDQAVERSAQSVHWTIRSFARPRLAPLATACPGYTTHVSGGTFHIRCDNTDGFEWKVGHSGPWTSKEGKEMTVSLTRKAELLTLEFAQEDGGKRFIYDFSGSSLKVTQQVYADKLPEPMVWTLDYRRP